MERFQKTAIVRDLDKKMVFLCGPRQVGKTWLAKQIALDFPNSLYLNYDRLEDREIIKNESWPNKTDLLILDEIHKMPEWKNRVKGIFDTRSPHLKILVTGSARLDILRQAGDSMSGRFFRHRLLPFSLAELSKCGETGTIDIDHLLERGGFPEPMLAPDRIEADRWRLQYIDGLMRNDIFDFNSLHDFKAMQTVLELLRRRVGSPVSYSSIAEDVSISPNTVKKYVEILESLYIIFRISPYSRNIARSLLKEPKIYFFDNGMVIGDEGAKFENLAAVNLLKHTWALNDYKGIPASLNYLRTKDGEEVDFCLVNNDKPELMLEIKIQSRGIPVSLSGFHSKFNIPGKLVVKELKREQVVDEIEIVSADSFFARLEL
jgi:predicted AAA+ superfamily ATPase